MCSSDILARYAHACTLESRGLLNNSIYTGSVTAQSKKTETHPSYASGIKIYAYDSERILAGKHRHMNKLNHPVLGAGGGDN